MSATERYGFIITATERTYRAETAAAPADIPAGTLLQLPAHTTTPLRHHRAATESGAAAERRALVTDVPSRTPEHSAALPSASELICALAGQYLSGAVCRHAHELVEIHRHRQAGTASAERLATRRAEHIRALDHWARRLPPASAGARKYSDSLGRLIDRTADVAAFAFHLLRTDEIGGERMHSAWTRLAELELEYADLVRDVAAGRRYLPGAPLADDDR